MSLLIKIKKKSLFPVTGFTQFFVSLVYIYSEVTVLRKMIDWAILLFFLPYILILYN